MGSLATAKAATTDGFLRNDVHDFEDRWGREKYAGFAIWQS